MERGGEKWKEVERKVRKSKDVHFGIKCEPMSDNPLIVVDC